jgi:hypothetical protein
MSEFNVTKESLADTTLDEGRAKTITIQLDENDGFILHSMLTEAVKQIEEFEDSKNAEGLAALRLMRATKAKFALALLRGERK